MYFCIVLLPKVEVKVEVKVKVAPVLDSPALGWPARTQIGAEGKIKLRLRWYGGYLNLIINLFHRPPAPENKYELTCTYKSTSSALINCR